MTVKELIEELEECNQNLEVTAEIDGPDDVYYDNDIEVVETLDGVFIEVKCDE